MLFAILEYPDTTFGATFTATRPGATIDSISDPAVGPLGNLRHPAIVLAQGIGPDDLRVLKEGFEKRYEMVQTLEQDLRRGRWLGRFQVPERAVAGTALQKVFRFQDRFGTLWTHAEAGVVHLRARVRDPVHGEGLARDLGEALAKDGVDAQVEVRELGAHDHGIWDELVQASIGMGS